MFKMYVNYCDILPDIDYSHRIQQKNHGCFFENSYMSGSHLDQSSEIYSPFDS